MNISTTMSLVGRGVVSATFVAVLSAAGSCGFAQTADSVSPKKSDESAANTASDTQVLTAAAFFDDEPSTETRMYRLDARLFSMIPDSEADSYRGAPGRNATITGIGGLVGPAYSDDDRSFGVKISPELVGGKYHASVKLTPWSGDSVITERTFDVDLSSMDAQTVELGRAKDGRVFKLSLLPGMEIHSPDKIKPISAAYKKVRAMCFDNSVVIENDTSYVGTILGLGDVETVYVDIAGSARVDFSLVKFPGSEKTGLLKDGRLRIKGPDKSTLDIYNVLSGNRLKLSDVPYEVWAKWAPATETTEEAVAKAIKEFEKRKAVRGVSAEQDRQAQRVLDRLKNGGRPRMRYGGRSGSDDSSKSE